MNPELDRKRKENCPNLWQIARSLIEKAGKMPPRICGISLAALALTQKIVLLVGWLHDFTLAIVHLSSFNSLIVKIHREFEGHEHLIVNISRELKGI